jgi:hypothetical protein
MSDPKKAKLFYHSGLASDDFGSWQIGNLTAVYHKQLPNARVGANFMGIISAASCPGQQTSSASSASGFFVGGCAFNYIGNVRQWIKPFREGALSLPWSEDWQWQSPLLSQQAVTLLFDVFRSGMRDSKSGNSLGVWSGSAPIMFYVMPHLGNTANSWRRQFYGDLSHGLKFHNTFEFTAPDSAYTCDSTPTINNYSHFKAVTRAWNEVSSFDDIIMCDVGRPTHGLGAKGPLPLVAPLRPHSLKFPTHFPLHLHAISWKLPTVGPPG